MADDVRSARAGHRFRRLGTSGGATRASTGYTFSALQRQGAAVAAAGLQALFAGEAELIPGVLNKVSAGLTSIVPKGIVEKIAASIYEKYL